MFTAHTLALHMEASSIECHACSEQYALRVPLLNCSRTLHLFPPLQVIPKQNFFIRGALRWDIFKTSLVPTQSWSPVQMMPPTQCPSPRPKRPLLIFNATVVLVCACESMGCTLTGSPYTQKRKLVHSPRGIGDGEMNSRDARMETANDPPLIYRTETLPYGNTNPTGADMTTDMLKLSL